MKIYVGEYDGGGLAMVLKRRYSKKETALLRIGKRLENMYNVIFSIVTINLPESSSLSRNTQFVNEKDTPGIGAWLIKNKIATATNLTVQNNGYNYKAYTFNIPLMKEQTNL